MRARPQDRSVLSTRERFFLRPPGLLACASRRVCFPVALIPPALLPCVLRRRAAAYLEEPPAKRVETNGVSWQCRRDGPPPYDGRIARLSSSITPPVFDFNTFPHAPTAHAYACARRLGRRVRLSSDVWFAMAPAAANRCPCMYSCRPNGHPDCHAPAPPAPDFGQSGPGFHVR